MHSILDSICGLFFGRCLFPTSTHWISKNIVFRLEKQGFLKTGLSKLTSNFDPILLPTWLDFGSKIQHNPPKDRFQEASKNDRFLDRFFGHLGFILGAKLGPCWLLFRLKRRDEVRNKPSEFGTKVNEFGNKVKRVRE